MWGARVVLLVVAASVGVLVAPEAEATRSERLINGLLIGLGFATVPLALDLLATVWPWQRVVGGLVGFTVGIGGAGIVIWVSDVVTISETMALIWPLGVLMSFGYLGWRFGATAGDLVVGPFTTSAPAHAASGLASGRKLLDTSVIIDGRIADLCETGFLDGVFVIPQFILHELQHIADSSDSLKRARGRRGLDILHRIQSMPHVAVNIVEEDFPLIKDVDAKLVALAKKQGAKIMTNDLNLNKVAELQGVQVLNINELTNALRPVVLPGEPMRVFVLREGKEVGQGVAYLDDGTMIVVDEAKKYIGRNVDVIVTSVLQTTAGRMIFTRLRDESERTEAAAARG
jgi:uncharacterized protein YacL